MWESAVVLARYLHDTGRPLIAGKRVLELGSGLGLCGFAAASHAACMVLTVRRRPPLDQRLEYA